MILENAYILGSFKEMNPVNSLFFTTCFCCALYSGVTVAKNDSHKASGQNSISASSPYKNASHSFHYNSYPSQQCYSVTYYVTE